MTTTTQQQVTDEVQIIRTPPTLAEAQLLVQMTTADAITGAARGHELLKMFETPPTLGQLRKKHPLGSDGYRQVNAFLMSCETLATFTKHGLVSLALVDDLYWVAGAWQVAEKVCRGLRREAGAPRLYENFEWLVQQTT